MDLIHAFIALQHLMSAINYASALYVVVIDAALQRSVERSQVERSPHPFQTQLVHLNRLFTNNDTNCHEQLRVDIRTFNIPCTLVRGVGLTDSKYVVLEEKVGMFLKTIAHHKKNRVIKFDFSRSGQTASKYFNQVLKAILKRQDVLLKHPELVPTNCDDERWKWFQGKSSRQFQNQNVEEAVPCAARCPKAKQYYEDLLHLFGKDRATRDLAEGAIDAAAAMGQEDAIVEQGVRVL
ncbi:hypothetical protein Vadar_030186 [Vaccinium darrowii]|uniref:Uncharacterized protein n=1 Tax=Vaccinium darrowii TaxID=229202 RepID=A0ACB7YZM7_9ERIC|nr:hypothetical protein Vadar_030186 [Vaccinium darrowii]